MSRQHLPQHQVCDLVIYPVDGIDVIVFKYSVSRLNISVDTWNFPLDPNMPPCVEGKAAQKALGLCHTQCWRGGGELPVSQETPGHCGFFPSNHSTFARGNDACCSLPPSARSTEF